MRDHARCPRSKLIGKFLVAGKFETSDGTKVQQSGPHRRPRSPSPPTLLFPFLSLIDGRGEQYYTDKSSGEEKPGKKGISLNVSQFEALVRSIGQLEDAVEKLK